MWDDEDYDDWIDHDGADDDESDPRRESLTIPCPECGFAMHEEAEMCSACGCFLEEDSAIHPLTGKPNWFVILGLLGVLATLFALLQMF